MGELRSVGKHTLIYGVGVLLGKVASFVMLPLYTHYLSTAQYGVLELLGTTIDIIGTISGIGLASAVFKFYAEVQGDSQRREVIGTVALGTIGLALLTAALGYVFSPTLNRAILGDGGKTIFFQLFFGIYFFSSVGGIPFLLLRAQDRSSLFVTLNLVKLVAQLALNIYFVVVLRLGVLGVLLGNLIAAAALAIGLTVYTLRYTGLAFSWTRFREMSRFGAPLVLWTLGSFVLTFSDRYFLRYYVNLSSVGIYSLAYKFSFVLSALAVAPFSEVWEPRRFAIARRADAQEIYGRMFVYLNLALVGGSALILLFVKDVLRILVAPAFWPAYHVIPLLLATTIVQQWTGYCNLGLYLRNATSLYAVSALVGVLAALGLNILLIPRFGIFGAAWATLFAYSLRFVPVYYFAQVKYRIEYPWVKVASLAGMLVAVYLIRSLFLDRLAVIPSLCGSAVILLLLVLTLYRQVLSGADRSAIRDLLRTWVLPVLARAS